MYCLYIPVLHVYVWMVCIVCIVCICMYLHVLYVLEILYVCVCIVCICLYISKRFFRYIHIHAHTYIHTIHTKYRYVANVCMCMYFRVNTYIIQTAGFTYRQIQTCRFPDVPVLCEACLHHPHLLPAPPSELTRPVLLPSFEVHGGNPFRLAAAIRVGKHDARGAAAALLTLRRRRVRNDDILAGDGLAAGLASMFRLRNGLRGSQSRMA